MMALLLECMYEAVSLNCRKALLLSILHHMHKVICMCRPTRIERSHDVIGDEYSEGITKTSAK